MIQSLTDNHYYTYEPQVYYPDKHFFFQFYGSIPDQFFHLPPKAVSYLTFYKPPPSIFRGIGRTCGHWIAGAQRLCGVKELSAVAVSGFGATGRAHPHSQPSALSGADASRAPDYVRRPGRGGGKPVSRRPCRVAGRARVAGRLPAILVGGGSGARIAGPRHPRGTARTHAPARNHTAAVATHARTHVRTHAHTRPPYSCRRSRPHVQRGGAVQKRVLQSPHNRRFVRTHDRFGRAFVRSFVRFDFFCFLKIFRLFYLSIFFVFVNFCSEFSLRLLCAP